ncbi:hypothetical protein GOA66_22810 [Sinorhizobium meliloti]|nr:hypothetical protein [Sinorhizobium meliloti]MDX0046602.1 hypothetical protein [Sinorhizobium meliloti]
MNVIASKKLRRGMRAENRSHFSSSRSISPGGCAAIVVQQLVPTPREWSRNG